MRIFSPNNSPRGGVREEMSHRTDTEPSTSGTPGEPHFTLSLGDISNSSIRLISLLSSLAGYTANHTRWGAARPGRNGIWMWLR